MNDQYCIYILRCADESYYVGQTNNIKQRLQDHRMKRFGDNAYTARRLPVDLVFVKYCLNRAEAQQFEREVKKWSRQKKEQLIQSWTNPQTALKS
jgi:putative endonuclease